METLTPYDFLKRVRSLFYQKTSSARKNLKKKNKQEHYFYKESMENYSSEGEHCLYLTSHNAGTKNRRG